MPSPPPPQTPNFEEKTFLWLLVLVTLAFGWILWPFFGTVFWAVVLAIVFMPMQRWFRARMRDRPTFAALATLAVILVIVILPLTLISAALLREGAGFYQRVQSGEFSLARYFQEMVGAFPPWIGRLLDRFGLADLAEIQHKLAAALEQGSRFLATGALGIGQNTLDFLVSFFIMLYLAFFLLRDGSAVARTVRDAIPLRGDHKRALFSKFATVIRATVKGNILVAAAQGALGGLAFWYLGVHGALLWAVLMAVLSLLPAVGAAIVWVPVALYFLVTGAVAKGIGLVAWGVLVIGLVDNVLRPILVGKDTKMPDWIVLISTLGGIAIFGLNGFVIGPVIAAIFIAAWDIFATERARA